MSKMQNPKYELDKVAYLSNDFIRYSTALQPLDELEINLFLYLCYKAKENACEEDDGWCAPIELDMKKFYDGIGYKKNWFDYTKEERKSVFDKLEKLQEKTFEVRTPKYIERKSGRIDCCYTYQSFSYLNHVKYTENEGVLEIVMNKETQKFLDKCDKNFTPIVFKNIISLKSKHAKLLYMFFRSYRDGIAYNRGTSLSIEHLRQLLGLNDKYPDWYNFKRYVLIPTMKEINSKTDILVVGKKDVYEDGMFGRKAEDMDAKEYAQIVVESMLQKGSHGKSIEKIFFHVTERDNHIEECLETDAFRIENMTKKGE